MKVRVLVTGGAGFIGSAIVDQLASRGDEILVVDNLSTGSEDNLLMAKGQCNEKLDLEISNIEDPETTEIIAAWKPSVIFHLAAQVDVRSSVKDPVRDAEVNLIGLLRVLEGARKAKTRKVIFASSGGTIYGEPDASLLPLDEKTTWKPLSPYGVAKLAGSLYVNAYSSLHGIKGVTLALANVYGPRQDQNGEAGVVAIFAGSLLENRLCTIFGGGKQTRDFIYVDDVASAFIAASEKADAGIFNIGTGRETSILHLYEKMASFAKSDKKPEMGEARIGELERSALDPTLAVENLGWKPSTDLNLGIRKTFKWFESQI